MWTTSYEHRSSADVTAVWQVIRDVASWIEWNDGIAALTVEGEVALGTEVRMTTPDGDVLPSTIVELVEGARLSDLTVVDGVSVRVDPDLAESPDGTLITYRVTVDGPVPDEVAEEIGRGASADFPQVLAAAAARAEAAARADIS